MKRFGCLGFILGIVFVFVFARWRVVYVPPDDIEVYVNDATKEFVCGPGREITIVDARGSHSESRPIPGFDRKSTLGETRTLPGYHVASECAAVNCFREPIRTFDVAFDALWAYRRMYRWEGLGGEWARGIHPYRRRDGTLVDFEFDRWICMNR